MENITKFLELSKTMIRQDRRNRLKFRITVPKKLTLSLIALLIIVTAAGFFWVINTLTDKSQAPITQPAPIVVSKNLTLIISFDSVNNDYVFPEIYLGKSYQIQANQMALWNAIFNDPNHPDKSESNIQNFVKTFIGSGISNRLLVERVKESSQTGVLNLIK